MADQKPFRVYLRVRYAECDPQGVVFNGRYVEYVDVAMTEYFRVVFGGYEKLVARGMETQVVGLKLDWAASARFDDVIALEIFLPKVGKTSITYPIKIVDRSSERVIAEVSITYVLVDAKTFGKIPIPDAVRDLLQQDVSGLLADLSGVYKG